jgi:hypothetical protein
VFSGAKIFASRGENEEDEGQWTVKKPANQSAKQGAAPVIERVPTADEQVDIVEVREDINNLVAGSAKDIVAKMIEVARETGQLALAKYLFEVVGLYPASEQTADQPKEDSLAEILLRRLGLPVRPVEGEEDRIAAGLADDEKSSKGQCVPTAGGEDAAGPRGNDTVE